MGLGKTVQISSYLAALKLSGQIRRALVVVPATLCDYWESELQRWGPIDKPKLRVSKVRGTKQARLNLLCRMSSTIHCNNGHEMELIEDSTKPI